MLAGSRGVTDFKSHQEIRYEKARYVKNGQWISELVPISIATDCAESEAKIYSKPNNPGMTLTAAVSYRSNSVLGK